VRASTRGELRRRERKQTRSTSCVKRGKGLARSLRRLESAVRASIGFWPRHEYEVSDEEGQEEPTLGCTPPNEDNV